MTLLSRFTLRALMIVYQSYATLIRYAATLDADAASRR